MVQVNYVINGNFYNPSFVIEKKKSMVKKFVGHNITVLHPNKCYNEVCVIKGLHCNLHCK